MRKTIEIECENCHKKVMKPLSEVKRNIRIGRRLFCSLSCTAVAANSIKRSTPIEKTCPRCGTVFMSSTHKKAATYCSASCASLSSVTEKRRAGNRKGGYASLASISQEEKTRRVSMILKSREQWKYSALKEFLGNRPHEFEYPIGNCVFDLALFDTKVLIEFDGRYHNGSTQNSIDTEKAKVGEAAGFRVIHLKTKDQTVISPETIEGI